MLQEASDFDDFEEHEVRAAAKFMLGEVKTWMGLYQDGYKDDLESLMRGYVYTIKQAFRGAKREEYKAASAREESDKHGVMDHFATPIYRAPLRPSVQDTDTLNIDIIRETACVRDKDESGRRLCQEGYEGGYTSYWSERKLNQVCGSAKQLEAWLEPHVRSYWEQTRLQGAARPSEFSMVECWVNYMGTGTDHDFHTHDFANISGTYYVKTPENCSGICFEDPRVGLTDWTEQRQFLEYPVHAGEVILFPSWLSHKVPPNIASDERISVSFNYRDVLQADRSPDVLE